MQSRTEIYINRVKTAPSKESKSNGKDTSATNLEECFWILGLEKTVKRENIVGIFFIFSPYKIQWRLQSILILNPDQKEDPKKLFHASKYFLFTLIRKYMYCQKRLND